MGKVIIIGNYKGGVGKTTTTIVLSSVFARKYRVLMIDLDPQSSLSEIVFKNMGKDISDTELYEEKLHFINNAFLDYLESYQLSIDNICDIVALPFNVCNNSNNVNSKLDILPNSLLFNINNRLYPLDDLSMIMGNDERFNFVFYKIFKDNDFYNRYDYIFIDTPPSSNIITQGAFLLADYLLIPSIMDKISVNGVQHYTNKIGEIYQNFFIRNRHCSLYKSVFKKEIKKLGIIETMRDRNEKFNPDLATSELRKKGEKVFNTLIKQMDSVVDATFSIKKIVCSDVNIGEGTEHLYPDREEGYNYLYNEIIDIIR